MKLTLEKLKELQDRSKKNNRETRYGFWMTRAQELADLTHEEIEKREAEEVNDEYYHIRGKAVTYNDTYNIYDDEMLSITERIDPHAFDEADLSDVVLNANHGDGNYAVARTRNKTLTFDNGSDGLYTDAKIRKDNPRTSQFYKDVSEGLLDRMSFAFTIKDYKRTEEESPDGKLYVRYLITKIDKVYDVSAVEFPAYNNTSISSTRANDLEKSFENLVKLEQKKKIDSMRSELIAKIEKALVSAK